MKTRKKSDAGATTVMVADEPVKTLTPIESLRKLYARLQPLAQDETLAGIKTVTLSDKVVNDAFIEINKEYTVRAIDGKMFEVSHNQQKQHLPKMDSDNLYSFTQAIDIGVLFCERFKSCSPGARDMFMVSFNHQIWKANIKGCQLVP